MIIESLILLPLIAALISGIFSRKLSNMQSYLITCAGILASSVLSWIVFKHVVIDKVDYFIDIFNWINIGELKTSWSIKVDSLTAVMLIVVTTISALVHIYSIGYMSDDPHVPRFMSYLSLFTFFMLMLVTSNNFIQLFFGWEGVGLCSYLLIGFWFKKESANKAAMKAFIVNRVGDVAFALGIFLIFLTFESVNFNEVFTNVGLHAQNQINIFGYSFNIIDFICILLFIGAMGKSAQIGLHTWLPDAMEGPTPVSALIHAATMVTAGVFLVARCSPLFEYAPIALNLVTIIGAVTCVFAASIALVQNDIKKIIAYSTCSQLGYMFFACGVSVYSAGIFHLMTHAFFKALLFLGAGSVIHAMSGEQDIRKMGGLWRRIPATYIMMFIGSLALAGIYPFAGYYSKDAILEASYASGSKVGIFSFYAGLLAAFLTAFYSWRLLILVFHGKFKSSEDTLQQVHESPAIMLLPLLILTIGAIAAGYVGYEIFNMVDSAEFWRNSIINNIETIKNMHDVPVNIKYLPLIAGGAGIFTASVLYFMLPKFMQYLVDKFSSLYELLSNKYYFDEIYEYLLINPLKKFSNYLWQIFDINLIDRFIPHGGVSLTNKMGTYLGKLQSGYLYHYAFITLIGVLFFITWTVFIFVK